MNNSKKSAIASAEWEKIEKDEHDRIYKDSKPFNSKTYKINPDEVMWWEDYCYKPNRRKDRGHRTCKVFEQVGLNDLYGKNILDVGCGNGQYSVLFALFGAKAYGFDISPVGISVAEKIAMENGVTDKCFFSVQNLSKTDYQDEFFDVVILHEVLHHAIKYPNVKQEILRVLKKGGKIVCAESLNGNILFKIGRFFTMKGQEAKGDVILTLSDLKKFSEGFSDSKIEMMSLFFMIKRVFHNHLNIALVRWFLFLVKKFDDLILMIFPFLKKYCGECVMVLIK